MTLHPWPLNDNRIGDHASVLWTGHSGRGLLSDSLAVPLRFMPESESLAPLASMASSPVEPAAEAFNPSALLCLREISSRFGSGA